MTGIDAYIPLLVGFGFIGFILLVVSTQYEAKHLRWAWEYLCDPHEHLHDTEEEALLERTRTLLRALKLVRLFALFLLIPSLALLVHMGAAKYLPGIGRSSASMLMAKCVVIALIVFLTITLVNAAFLRGLGIVRPLERRGDPSWLSEESRPIPALLAAASLVWGWFHRRSDWMLHSLDVQRPRGQLYEQDGEVRLAVGEMEVGAVGEARSRAGAAADSTERTERDMIRSIQRLDQTLVREIMRPLNKVTAVAITNLTPEKFLALARRTGYTRFPCYYDQITNLIGYLNVYDFLEKPTLPKDLRQMVHTAPFLPEVARVDAALQEMLRSKAQVAICFDEFGGCSGLLSREDIFEEITGEIMDEYDRPEAKITFTHGHYIVDASMDLDDLAEETGLVLEKWSADTLAGYIYHRLSRIPRRGEQIEEQDWTIEVVQMESHRIRKVKLLPPTEVEEESNSG